MTAKGERTDPWGSFEPYAQLIRSLMPRAVSVTVFDANGEMRWTSETTTGPDLAHLIVDVLPRARESEGGTGELRSLPNGPPVYFCWLKDERQALVAIVGVVCRPSSTAEADPARSFALAYAFLRPALECMRRDLLARTLIEDLNRSVTSLDKDLELLLTDSVNAGAAASDNTDELKSIVQQAMDHLGCVIAALIVPDKGIVQMRTAPGQPSADNQLVARTHRQLLSMAQTRPEPIIINRFNANGSASVPYRILSGRCTCAASPYSPSSSTRSWSSMRTRRRCRIAFASRLLRRASSRYTGCRPNSSASAARTTGAASSAPRRWRARRARRDSDPLPCGGSSRSSVTRGSRM